MKKVYIIWIWGIGISAISRYYLQNWYEVFGSDSTASELIENMKNEGIDIFIWERPEIITSDFEKIIYTEAISQDNKEFLEAKNLWIQTITYPQELASIANNKKLIAIAWSHWKSTTASMTAITMKNSPENVNAVIWTILKEFDNKNCYFSDSEYMVIEACEYKRSFLNYKPYILVITNIDLDHLDYYKDLEDYISAFREFSEKVIEWWYIILNWDCQNSMKLFNLRKDVTYVVVYKDNFDIKIELKIPWKHILFDAFLVFRALREIVDFDIIKKSLENYNGVWRRSEIIWKTQNWNILISDYGHHPTEIKLNLEALKNKYSDKKILTIFQPHQYNRTLELLEDFKNSFVNTDFLIIPNIYESRDTPEDKEKINTQKLVNFINHNNKQDWKWLDNTLNLIKEFDEKYKNELIIILQWAWDIDNLRYNIKTSIR